MPSIAVTCAPHLSSATAIVNGPTSVALDKALPQLIQTPTGLALLEIQGTINFGPTVSSQDSIPVGSLVFSGYNPEDITGSKAWMKTVHLYVGQHQRLTGELKKLPKAIAILRKITNEESESLEITEIVEWKILFANRPEPVGN